MTSFTSIGFAKYFLCPFSTEDVIKISSCFARRKRKCPRSRFEVLYLSTHVRMCYCDRFFVVFSNWSFVHRLAHQKYVVQRERRWWNVFYLSFRISFPSIFPLDPRLLPKCIGFGYPHSIFKFHPVVFLRQIQDVEIFVRFHLLSDWPNFFLCKELFFFGAVFSSDMFNFSPDSMRDCYISSMFDVGRSVSFVATIDLLIRNLEVYIVLVLLPIHFGNFETRVNVRVDWIKL